MLNVASEIPNSSTTCPMERYLDLRKFDCVPFKSESNSSTRRYLFWMQLKALHSPSN
ncbi:unnamed protein product [Acidithrix sp. C25]|nr:unnamed protein product [Acidithrix sp. C25]